MNKMGKMKLMSKRTDWNNFTYLAGHSDKDSIIEFHNNSRGPQFKVTHHAEDSKLTIIPMKRLTITFNSMTQRKSLIRGLRFMADVLEGEYDGIESEERIIENDGT